MIYYGKTDIGLVRKQNQDYIYLSKEDSKIKLYIIADGMGGANAGDVASKEAVAFVKKYIADNYTEKSDTEIKDLIRSALARANEYVYDLSKKHKEYDGMGTTIIVLLLINNKAYIGHIGDSSLYRIRKNIIRKITKDHSYVQKLIDNKEITKKEAKNHPKKNMLLRVLGCEPIVESDIIVKKFEKGDYILMCTDGLTNLVSNKEMLITIDTLKDSKKICEKLINMANSRGGIDNISAILIYNN